MTFLDCPATLRVTSDHRRLPEAMTKLARSGYQLCPSLASSLRFSPFLPSLTPSLSPSLLPSDRRLTKRNQHPRRILRRRRHSHQHNCPRHRYRHEPNQDQTRLLRLFGQPGGPDEDGNGPRALSEIEQLGLAHVEAEVVDYNVGECGEAVDDDEA